ncbi:MAG TPA: helix-turn-helix transcriptional regulator, partial [Gemmatimonadaceae bacterium]|nr:helix-turn-helix transcriptional regulator [Gemmatimonadaceae bacterium]
MRSLSLGPIQERRIESDLGAWTHSECRPPKLAGMVDLLWHFQGRMTLLRERHFPSGLLGLIVHLGPRYREVEPLPNDTYPLVSIGGLQTSSFLIEAPPGECCVLGVELHPAGARALLRIPLSEITGATVDLEDLVGSEARELADRCAQPPRVRERFRIVVDWIAARALRDASLDPAVTWMAERLARSHGAVPITALQARIGYSRARLANAFRDQVGLTPKRYARVLRFRRALTLLTEARLPFSTLALTAGYYDQPHMNAEFKEFSGFTPGE